ncbi:MAG TPA: SLC13 family permease [Thermodesulfobacteriota bacterium]|nr:SLC13 family permease [Thermodesulfobacteriota bacterium]
MEDLRLLEIPLFSGLDRINLAKLIPELERASYKPGEILFKQGDPGDSLFIITDGKARVFLQTHEKGGEEITVFGPKECFGEMALLTGEPRSASIQAVTDLSVFKLSRERFDNLLRKHHSLAIYFAGVLARRLASANRDLRSLRKLSDTGEKEDGACSPALPTQITGISPIHPRLSASRLVQSVFNKTVLGVILVILLCSALLFSMLLAGIHKSHLIILELLLAATILWSLNLFSYHAIAVALPVLAVLFGTTTAEKAFSGFSNPAWFLVLGVFAISAAISKTGLLYRLVLLIIRRFPPSYAGNSLALAFSGMILTPVIPSSLGRAALVGPVALTLAETLRLKDRSTGSVGLAMSCLLGFGHMSFMFMNGAAICLLVYGLLPAEVSQGITWGFWLKAAFPMGIVFFVLSYLAIVLLYRPEEKISISSEVIEAQLKTLGSMTSHEKISLFTVLVTLIGFLTQPWHGINGAWVAMLGFFILFGTSVLDEKAVRSDIDWNFLISFGALVGFGNVMSSSGLTAIIAKGAHPCVEFSSGNTLFLLIAVSVAAHLLRFALPVSPALLIGMLSIQSVLTECNVSPFVVGLILLNSTNPFFLPYQNTLYLSILQGTEGKMFHHRQIINFAFLHIAIVLVSIALSIPYWKYLGLIH